MSDVQTLRVFVVSDGTGRTAQQALNAAMTQFPTSELSIERRSQVREEAEILDIVHEAADSNAIIVHTLVTDPLRRAMFRIGREHNIDTIDLMGPLLARMSDHLAVSPTEKPGLFRQLNEVYFRRIETMEYALSHDDGLRSHELAKAEIVLLGVSRTFKTPLSVYLAFKGWFVANVPILNKIPPPKILETLPPERVYCLDTNTALLTDLRRSRAEYLGGTVRDYGDFLEVRSELAYARAYFSEHPWRVVSVANKPIEEIASEILALQHESKGESD